MRNPVIYLCFILFMLPSAMTACTPSDKSTPKRIAAESQKLNEWFDARFEDELARSPMTQTYFGLKTSQHKLDNVSEAFEAETITLKKSWLEILRKDFNPELLNDQAHLSYRLFIANLEDELKTYASRDHDYIFQHMNGPHTELPSFMINFHAVSSTEDARAYIARLRDFDNYLGAQISKAENQAKAGIYLPEFVYEKISTASENVIIGAPFSAGGDSPLLTDFKAKISPLDIPQDDKDQLVEEAITALNTHVKPAYNQLLDMFAHHAAQASDQDGVWKLPNGESYYQTRLNHYTTTDMRAEQIHQIGLKEVARIQNEMRKIMAQVSFEGDLQDFYHFLRTDPQFTYENNDTGRATYIREATAIIEDMKNRLDKLFLTKPKANMIVKRVEPFREDTAFGAFYDQPALDGSRPGIYYINLRDVREQPIYLMQALAYHEGIPGHHMQIAIGLELKDLPRFRTLSHYTSYVEGWALYSESLGKEIGAYTDPYKDFGRLSMEIFRAARLVVDTGIHAKKWTREQAVQYFLNNIPNPEGDVRAEIDRYIVWPGQATAYKIGMLKIMKLRHKAQQELGPEFDIRAFHDVILANGAVPLYILEELVNEWIKTVKA